MILHLPIADFSLGNRDCLVVAGDRVAILNGYTNLHSLFSVQSNGVDHSAVYHSTS